MQRFDIGIVGLGVMGENLALNFERNGFAVGGFDHESGKRESFAARAHGAHAASSLDELVEGLRTPRRVLIMVPAGAAVDLVLAGLRPLLEAGDVIIDGGNTLFTDTQRRMLALEGSGVLYVGTGVSAYGLVIQGAVVAVFNRMFNLGELEGAVNRFKAGLAVEVGDMTPSQQYARLAQQIEGLPAAVEKAGSEGSEGEVAAAVEFIFEGLHLNKRLNKDRVGGKIQYRG